MTEKAIAYLRVSSDRQDEHSFDTQYRNILEYLEGKKWTRRNERLEGVELELDTRVTCKLEKEGGGVFQADGCFAEKGSAYDLTEDREQFNEMINYVKKHKIKHLIFYKADRFSRNDEDWGVTKRQLREAGLTDIYIHVLFEELAFNPFDKKDFEQKDKLGDHLKKAERESHDRSIYATEGIKTKLEKGELFYFPGYGLKTYTIRRGDVKTHHVELIEEELEDVRTIFKEFAKGNHSLTQFVSRLKELGIQDKRTGKSFTRQRLHTILTNVIFIGFIRKKGQKPVKSSQFKAQVDRADWDKTQSILSRRNTRREITGTGYKSPLSKIMRCQFCGMKIVTDPKPSKKQNYLRCSHGHIFKDPCNFS